MLILAAVCPGHRTKGRLGSFEKDRSFFNQTANGIDHIQIAGDEDHRRMRRLQSHAFSEKALRSQEDILKKYVDLLMRKLHARAANQTTAIVDMVKWLNFTTFDVIGDLAFGESFGCLEQGVWHKWITAVFSMVRAGNWIRAARRFPQPLSQLSKLLIPRDLIEERKYQFIFSRDKVNRRLEQGTKRSDFSKFPRLAVFENFIFFFIHIHIFKQKLTKNFAKSVVDPPGE